MSLLADCKNCGKTFKINKEQQSRQTSNEGEWSTITACPHCDKVSFIQVARGSVADTLLIDRLDDTVIHQTRVKTGLFSKQDITPSFLKKVKPPIDGRTKIHHHEGNNYWLIYDNKGRITHWSTNNELINTIKLIRQVKPTRISHPELTYESVEERISSLTKQHTQLISDLKRKINEEERKIRKPTQKISDWRESLTKYQSGYYLTPNDKGHVLLDFYIYSRITGESLEDIDEPPEFIKERVDEFVELNSGKDDDEIYSEALRLKDELKKELGSDYLEVSLNLQLEKINELSKLIKNERITQTKSVILSDYLKSLSQTETGTSDEIIKSRIERLLGRYDEKIFKTIKKRIMKWHSEMKLDELEAVSKELIELKKRKTILMPAKDENLRVYESKGYQLKDLIHKSEIELLFTNQPTINTMLQAVDNLRTLIAHKIRDYPFTPLENKLRIILPEDYFGLKDLIQAKNQNAVKELESLDQLIGDYVATNEDISYREFIRLYKSELSTLPKKWFKLIKLEINYHKKDLKLKREIQSKVDDKTRKYVKKEKSVDWYMTELNKLASEYVKSNKRNKNIKTIILSGIESALMGLLFMPRTGFIPKVIRDYKSAGNHGLSLEQAINNAFNEYLSTESRPEDSEQALNALITYRNRLIHGEDFNDNGVLDEGEDLDGDGELDREGSINYLEEQAGLRINEAESLESEAELLDADYITNPGNNYAEQVYDLIESYESVFSVEVDEEAMFTDDECPYNVFNQTLTADCELGSEGDPNPFYWDKGTTNDNWSDEQDEGIEDILNHHEAEDKRGLAAELRGEAAALISDSEELQAIINGLSPVIESVSNFMTLKQEALSDFYQSMTGSVGLIIGAAAIGGYLGYKLSHKLIKSREGPLGKPDLDDETYLVRTAPRADKPIILEFEKKIIA